MCDAVHYAWLAVTNTIKRELKMLSMQVVGLCMNYAVIKCQASLLPARFMVSLLPHTFNV